MKNICFILPHISRAPVGGYKMVFEYANRLACDGNKVQLLFMNDDALKQYHLPEFIRVSLSNLETKVEPRWFHLDSSIKKISSNDKKWIKSVAHTDVVIATNVESVPILEKIFRSQEIKKAYFIQDYENWNVGDEVVRSTYALGYINIVVSEWLQEVVDKYSKKPSILIKNPIDLNVYKIIVPVTDRKEHTVSVLYHENDYKGVKYALEALNLLHDFYPDLEVYMFGVFDYKKDIPWIHYKQRASQQQTVDIYNKTRVFLCATIEEGYGLTGLEAMACGNVLISTNYQGVREYAKDGYNALLSPVKDVDALVENVKRVFEDNELSQRLVKNGQESMKNFSWDEAYKKFEKAIIDNTK